MDLGPFRSTVDNVPAVDLNGAPVGALRFYFNVPPGDYDILFRPPVGVSGQCTTSFMGSGFQTGWSIGPTEFRFRVEAGYVNGAGYIYCTP